MFARADRERRSRAEAERALARLRPRRGWRARRRARCRRCRRGPSPSATDVVPRDERLELAPQVGVLHRLLVRGLPAVALPAVDPGLDAVLHVLRVGVEVDVATARFSDSSARITAVSSMRLLVVCASPPKSSFSCSPRSQQRAPAAGAGIALAGAVGVDRRTGAPLPMRRCALAAARRRSRRLARAPSARACRRRERLLAPLAALPRRREHAHAEHRLGRAQEVDAARDRPPAVAGRLEEAEAVQPLLAARTAARSASRRPPTTSKPSSVSQSLSR